MQQGFGALQFSRCMGGKMPEVPIATPDFRSTIAEHLLPTIPLQTRSTDRVHGDGFWALRVY